MATSPTATARTSRSFTTRLLLVLLVLAALAALYFWAALNWNYSDGERAGWVQKLSRKGWLCKTWEGELAMVSLPGTAPEKFLFTIRDTDIAEQVTRAMGKRVSLHYEEKVGLPTSCFGETRYFVGSVIVSDEIPLAPGISVPSGAPPASIAPPAPIVPPVSIANTPSTPPQPPQATPPPLAVPPSPPR